MNYCFEIRNYIRCQCENIACMMHTVVYNQFEIHLCCFLGIMEWKVDGECYTFQEAVKISRGYLSAIRRLCRLLRLYKHVSVRDMCLFPTVIPWPLPKTNLSKIICSLFASSFGNTLIMTRHGLFIEFVQFLSSWSRFLSKMKRKHRFWSANSISEKPWSCGEKL